MATSYLSGFTSFPGLFRSRILFYHACLLVDNMSTFHAQSCRGYREKQWTDGRTHAHTHTQTDYNNPRCACTQVRVNNVSPAMSKPTLPLTLSECTKT